MWPVKASAASYWRLNRHDRWRGWTTKKTTADSVGRLLRPESAILTRLIEYKQFAAAGDSQQE